MSLWAHNGGIGVISSLEIARGNVVGYAPVNKFGRSTNVDSDTNTDIWNRANVADDQAIWIAPTAARIHIISSDNASDTTGGSGANSVQISYLPDWNTAETTETVTGNLNGGIAMINAAVMINRMAVIPQPSSLVTNIGAIAATAVDDGTVTAQIEPGTGQTQMAIYGLPSTQVLYVTSFYGSILRANLAPGERFVDMRLLFNSAPELNQIVFGSQPSIGVGSRGSNPFQMVFAPENPFPGPGILKLQAIGSANNLDVSGGFNGYLVDN